MALRRGGMTGEKLAEDHLPRILLNTGERLEAGYQGRPPRRLEMTHLNHRLSQCDTRSRDRICRAWLDSNSWFSGRVPHRTPRCVVLSHTRATMVLREGSGGEQVPGELRR